jgi:hypothetical protein
VTQGSDLLVAALENEGVALAPARGVSISQVQARQFRVRGLPNGSQSRQLDRASAALAGFNSIPHVFVVVTSLLDL